MFNILTHIYVGTIILNKKKKKTVEHFYLHWCVVVYSANKNKHTRPKINELFIKRIQRKKSRRKLVYSV